MSVSGPILWALGHFTLVRLGMIVCPTLYPYSLTNLGCLSHLSHYLTLPVSDS